MCRVLLIAADSTPALRLKGLDFRQLADYARVESGSGGALYGAEYDEAADYVGETDGRPFLRGVSVPATKLVVKRDVFSTMYTVKRIRGLLPKLNFT